MNDTQASERVAGSDGKSYPASYEANRAAIRAAIEADPDETNTAIAKRLGTSRDTVLIVRADMENTRAMLEGHAPYQVMWPLSEPEYAALKADIAARGVMVPVDYDDEGNVLDGHHRVRAVEELRAEDPVKYGALTWARKVRKGLTEEQKRTHARKLNALRRQLDGDAKRALVIAQLEDTPGLSDRQLAALLGVSQPFVSEVRVSVAPQGGDVITVITSPPEKATGADGKQYPRDPAALRRAIRAHIDADPTANNSAIAAALDTTRDTVRDERRAMEADAAAAYAKPSASVDVSESDARKAAALSDADRAAVLNGDKTAQQAVTEARREERTEALATIARGNAPLDAVAERFPVLYVDPPWRYEHVKTESRAIENHYPTMALEEIMSLDVADITTTDCVIFMWATSPKLAEAMQVIEAWGFEYRTCAVWVKNRIGMGYYFRQQHELLLVATRGNPPTPKPEDRVSSVLSYDVGEHSTKPPEIAAIIESMYPTLPKVELFARAPRDGWAVWGNQAGSLQ